MGWWWSKVYQFIVQFLRHLCEKNVEHLIITLPDDDMINNFEVLYLKSKIDNIILFTSSTSSTSRPKTLFRNKRFMLDEMT